MSVLNPDPLVPSASHRGPFIAGSHTLCSQYRCRVLLFFSRSWSASSSRSLPLFPLWPGPFWFLVLAGPLLFLLPQPFLRRTALFILFFFLLQSFFSFPLGAPCVFFFFVLPYSSFTTGNETNSRRRHRQTTPSPPRPHTAAHSAVLPPICDRTPPRPEICLVFPHHHDIASARPFRASFCHSAFLYQISLLRSPRSSAASHIAFFCARLQSHRNRPVHPSIFSPWIDLPVSIVLVFPSLPISNILSLVLVKLLFFFTAFLLSSFPPFLLSLLPRSLILAPLLSILPAFLFSAC